MKNELTITGPGTLDDPTWDAASAVHAARKDALELTASVVAVTTEAELADAIAAASLARSITDGIDKAYKRAKAPILLATSRLDDLRHGVCDALVLEIARLNKLSTAYVTARDAKARRERELAAAALAQKTAAAVEAGANADDLRDLALARNELAVKPAVPGALARETWDYECLSAAALWQARPDLVELVPKRREILAAIAGGVNLPGLRVYQETKIRARA